MREQFRRRKVNNWSELQVAEEPGYDGTKDGDVLNFYTTSIVCSSEIYSCFSEIYPCINTRTRTYTRVYVYTLATSNGVHWDNSLLL